MSRTRIRWLVIGLVAAAGLGLVSWLLAPRAVDVDVASVTVGPISETVQDQGATRVREAYVVAAPLAGRLERLDLHVGDRVIAGKTLIARIHPSEPEFLDSRARAQAEAALAAAGAAVSAARATRERFAASARLADQTLARTRLLVESGSISRQVFDNAEAERSGSHAALAAADADLAAREAQLVAARAALLGPGAESHEVVPVTSPATGYVTRVLQESERTVAAGTPLLEVGERSGLEAQIEFLSQDAVRISEGMPAEIYDWGGVGVIPAVVRRVEPEGFVKTSALGVEEHRVLVMLQFQGSSEQWARMGPGYGVWGRVFLRQEKRALKVPLGALIGSGHGWAVFRVEQGRARVIPITVGAITDTYAESRSGLRAGDQVIVFPSDRIREGVAVTPRRPGRT